jgi:hypothetical protein
MPASTHPAAAETAILEEVLAGWPGRCADAEGHSQCQGEASGGEYLKFLHLSLLSP